MPGRNTRAITHDKARIGFRFSRKTTTTHVVTNTAYSTVDTNVSQLLIIICALPIDRLKQSFYVLKICVSIANLANFLHYPKFEPGKNKKGCVQL